MKKTLPMLAAIMSTLVALPAQAKGSLATILCPQQQMSIEDYGQLGRRGVPRAAPLLPATSAAIDKQLAAALKLCGKQSGWSKAQLQMARDFTMSDAAYEVMDMRFAARGVKRDDVILSLSKLTDAQKQAVASGTMQASGTLDAVIAEMKSRKIRMNFEDTNTRQDIEALFKIAAIRFGILGKFAA